MWTYFLIIFCFSNVQLTSTYYFGSAYYQTAQYNYPQFYTPNNDVPFVCFIYFPGFVYYPQHSTQQQQYPMLAPFYDPYQTFTSNSNAANGLSPPKTNKEQPGRQVGTEQSLSIVGVPVIFTNIKNNQHAPTDNKEYSSADVHPLGTTQISVTERDTEQPVQQNSTEHPLPVPLIPLPIFITPVRPTQPSVTESEKLSPIRPSTTESEKLSSSTTEYVEIAQVLGAGIKSQEVGKTSTHPPKEWDYTESSNLFKEEVTEKHVMLPVTEAPLPVKEWYPLEVFADSVATTTESKNEGSGSGDGGIFIDDED